MSKIYADNSQSIGNTPLVKLNHVTAGAKEMAAASDPVGTGSCQHDKNITLLR